MLASKSERGERGSVGVCVFGQLSVSCLCLVCVGLWDCVSAWLSACLCIFVPGVRPSLKGMIHAATFLGGGFGTPYDVLARTLRFSVCIYLFVD